MNPEHYYVLIEDGNINELIRLLSEDREKGIISSDDQGNIITFQTRLFSLFKRIVRLNKINMMEILLNEFNFDLSYHKFFPLIYCSSYGEPNMMNFLIEYSKINCLDSENKIVHEMMTNSCEGGDIEMVKVLLQNGVDPNSHNGKYLIIASKFNYTNIAEILIEYGANVVCRNNEPLFKAITKRNYSMVKLLLQYGANMEAVNRRFAEKQYCKKHNDFINLLVENDITMIPWINFLMRNNPY